MGCIFQNAYPPEGQTYKDARQAGTLRKAGPWWAKYRQGGRIIKESTGTAEKSEAKRFLKLREGAVAAGKLIAPRSDKITMAHLADGIRQDYAANDRSTDRLEFALAHVLDPDHGLGHLRAVDVGAPEITRYVAMRKAAGAANGTINRELGTVGRMFSLASDRLPRAPKIRKLAENNVRTGFFERDQFERVRDSLPECYRGVVTFAYITGWRVRSEVLTLTWTQVDFTAGTVRLEPGSTKNGDGRMFYMTSELRATLEAARAYTDAITGAGTITPLAFHRNGRPIAGFRKAWMRACKVAGCPGRIPHDFCRTAVRNLERAGVSRSVAMKMVGHRTEAMYRRYAIVPEGDLREGAAKLDKLNGPSIGPSGGEGDRASEGRCK